MDIAVGFRKLDEQLHGFFKGFAPGEAYEGIHAFPGYGGSMPALWLLGSSGYSAQVLGQFPSVQNIPETGINGSTLPNGDTLRLGKVGDPFNTSRKAFLFQLAPNDPLTSGSHRSEFEFPMNIELGKTYWIAYSVYVYDWGTLMNNDDALFGTQVHSGNSNLGLSPSFTIYTAGSTGGRAEYRPSHSSALPSLRARSRSA